MRMNRVNTEGETMNAITSNTPDEDELPAEIDFLEPCRVSFIGPMQVESSHLSRCRGAGFLVGTDF